MGRRTARYASCWSVSGTRYLAATASLRSSDLQCLLLILIDAEGDLPCRLAPEILRRAKEARSDTDIVCVMPNPMFETWFAAAAHSLRGVNGLPPDLAKPDDPEGQRVGKAWVRRSLSRKYRVPVDQPRFAAQMNLTECRNSSPSFDKLCRELEARLPGSRSTATPPPS
jgi:hypothetical protein